jgi:Cu/Ag efflux pump CusA
MLRTCYTQMRPVVMTCVVAGVGLLPAAFSTGVGSQVQKPLALVVVGGMALAPLLILLVLPVLILTFSRRKPDAGHHHGAHLGVAGAQHRRHALHACGEEVVVEGQSVVDSLLALSVIPMAMAGGILALSLTGTSFSVSAAIGFIALLGIS